MFRSLTLDDIDPNWRAGRWRQGAPLGTPGGMTVPVTQIFVHHTVSADTGDVVADVAGPCDTDQHNFGKVSYSWNIHESTNSVIEVEGTHRGAHTINNAQQSLNGISFGFGIIGNFHPSAPNPTPREPSDALLRLIADAIIEKAIKPGYAAPDVPIFGHRDVYATACCGDSLYAKLPAIRTLVSAPPIPHPPISALMEARMVIAVKSHTGIVSLCDTSSGFVTHFQGSTELDKIIAAGKADIVLTDMDDGNLNLLEAACQKVRANTA